MVPKSEDPMVRARNRVYRPVALSSSLQNLPVPYTEPRAVTVTVEPAPVPVTLRANGRQLTVVPDAGRQSFEVTL